MKRFAACALLAACGQSEPAPPPSGAASTPPPASGALEAPPAIAHGDTVAAIAHARAVLAVERHPEQDSIAASSADLLEGLLDEDPQQIGSALARLAQSVPRKLTSR